MVTKCGKCGKDHGLVRVDAMTREEHGSLYAYEVYRCVQCGREWLHRSLCAGRVTPTKEERAKGNGLKPIVSKS